MLREVAERDTSCRHKLRTFVETFFIKKLATSRIIGECRILRDDEFWLLCLFHGLTLLVPRLWKISRKYYFLLRLECAAVRSNCVMRRLTHPHEWWKYLLVWKYKPWQYIYIYNSYRSDYRHPRYYNFGYYL